MIVLGYHGALLGYPERVGAGHDSAAAIVVDGEVVAACVGVIPDGDLNGLPDANDIVIIANAHTVNVNLASACSAMTINGSGIVAFTGNFTLAVGGALTMNGTSQITGNNTAQILNAATTFSVPGAATNAIISGITFTVTSTSSIAGTFTLSSDTGVKTFIGTVTNSALRNALRRVPW